MSNALAPATVTLTLTTRVTSLLQDASVSGMQVTTGHPKADPDAGVYVHLYRITPNTSLRNIDLPTRGADGGPLNRPIAAMDLHYLVSFVGDVDTTDAERLAGIVLSDLLARPLLSSEEIDDAVSATPVGSPLRSSDLARQPERVRLTLSTLDHEGYSRVWGTLNQSFHALSIAVQAGPVLLDGTQAASVALPVKSIASVTSTARRPSVSRAANLTTGQPLVVPGDTLEVVGADLGAGVARLRLGGVAVTPTVTGPGRLTWVVTSAVPPGVHALVVDHMELWPADGSLRVMASSPPVAVAVAPSPGATALAGSGDARTLSVAISPSPTGDQVAELLLSSGTSRVSLRSTSIAGGSAVFVVGALTGTWELRLSVDGVLSMPITAGDGSWALPSVTL